MAEGVSLVSSCDEDVVRRRIWCLFHVLVALILVLKQDSSYRNLEHKSIVGIIIVYRWLYLGFVEVFGTV